MKQPIKQKQSGFIILMGMLLLVVGASIWFGSLGNIKSNQLKLIQDDQYKAELHLIKQRMLEYAVLQPELFSNLTVEPGVGYFPCPDLNGDGVVQNVTGLNETSCGTHDPTGVDQIAVVGMVPYKITNRNFTLIDSDLNNRVFWYAVDARFVSNSQVFTSFANNRFAEINVALPTQVTQVTSGGNSAPIFLDGEDQIVMVLFYAGEALSDLNQSRPSSDFNDYLEQPGIVQGDAVVFNSVGANPDTFNDYVIPITRKEWEAAVLSRVSQDANGDGIPDFCVDITATDVHWFNDCVYNSVGNAPNYSCAFDSTAIDNIAGQSWRNELCPPSP